MKTCAKCGAQNANNAAVCKSCGEDLNTVAVSEEVLTLADKPPYKIVPSIIFSLAAILLSSAKLLLALNPANEDYKQINYTLHFCAIGISLILAIVSAILLRGLFSKKPVPMLGVFAMMLTVIAFVILVFDGLNLPYVISDYRDILKYGHIVEKAPSTEGLDFGFIMVANNMISSVVHG